MARKFLYVVAFLIALVIAGAVVYRIWGNELIRWTFVPGTPFETQGKVAERDYDRRDMWLARPDLPGNPALWTPAGYKPRETPGGAAIFFIHPTSYINDDHWNAPLNDAEANERAALFLRGQASAFNEAGEIWAPRYRQATFGSFLTDAADAQRALNLAYGDIQVAFAAFLRQIGPTQPIVLAGHSQGALHLSHLLKDKVAGTPLARRIVAAYVVGWPVSPSNDLVAMGFPECTRADQRGCILSWATFGEPADPSLVMDTYDRTTGFDGKPRRGTQLVCTNPLTGVANATAPATANTGTLFPSADLSSAQIEAGRVPARCGERGLLLIGEGPNVGPYVLPGNNYHVYDYSLFWANVRADVARRLAVPAPPVQRPAAR
ncbi:DUF3089 domain-containing protein [Sphingomonas radiodurans]|uniref:DUF3089 domain-containing protein n=1 Tax=Sphingomonas radiodurans TaxID=2890321 RepID=UPI001E44754D|nr:DUF3089 domain-containing protein [Sphingomonas radiodurans]WBH16876.1 DUF3089 domain-containing protein [Sphingomonas radiodurans]